MTNLQRIINHLSNGHSLCDDCLSEESGVKPRQTVNRLCRENSHLILERDDVACEGQCRKENKILRFIPRQNSEIAKRSNNPAGASDAESALTVDGILGNTKPTRNDAPEDVETFDAFSRREYLHDNFNEIIAHALCLPPANYHARLTLDGLICLKEITSNIHALITLRLTFALVDWLQTRLKLMPEQVLTLNDSANSNKPFVAGFDLDSINPNLVAEVKGNIPVRGGSAFEAAQLKGLTNDVRQMFGLPPTGKILEGMSKRSKVHRPNLVSALKFLCLYDSPRVRAAADKWMETFRRAHTELKVKLAEQVEVYKPDTVYIVFLTLGPAD